MKTQVRTLKHNESKHLRRKRPTYHMNGVRSDGARVYRAKPFASRSKYVPHEGVQQKAKKG